MLVNSTQRQLFEKSTWKLFLSIFHYLTNKPFECDSITVHIFIIGVLEVFIMMIDHLPNFLFFFPPIPIYTILHTQTYMQVLCQQFALNTNSVHFACCIMFACILLYLSFVLTLFDLFLFKSYSCSPCTSRGTQFLYIEKRCILKAPTQQNLL